MLFRKTVAVYCENHMEHTNTVRTSQETHYVSYYRTQPVNAIWGKLLFIVRTILLLLLLLLWLYSPLLNFGLLFQFLSPIHNW
jgi:hypothetical protein